MAEKRYFQSAKRPPRKRVVNTATHRVSAVRRRVREFGPAWRLAQIQLLESKIQKLQSKLDLYRSVEP